ncbi:MAG: adenylate/guanylate cyclase domain-containing protein, partial [Tepidiformaceae bacterium]
MPSERLARQVERLLDDCDSAISNGDWERVRQAAEAALRLDPGNADASAYLAAAQRPATAPTVANGAPPPPRNAERRQLTVMFCDLVDSTPLTEQLDPEDLRDILRAYQETCDQIVRRYDGFIAHYMGDGLLVYFGYPQAHEDDGVRAVLAGLEIVRAVPALAGSLPGVELQSRVGIHHGLVVVGQMGAGTRI